MLGALPLGSCFCKRSLQPARLLGSVARFCAPDASASRLDAALSLSLWRANSFVGATLGSPVATPRVPPWLCHRLPPAPFCECPSGLFRHSELARRLPAACTPPARRLHAGRVAGKRARMRPASDQESAVGFSRIRDHGSRTTGHLARNHVWLCFSSLVTCHLSLVTVSTPDEESAVRFHGSRVTNDGSPRSQPRERSRGGVVSRHSSLVTRHCLYGCP